jgi:hypothetical protein
MHARVWYGDETSRVALTEMTVGRTCAEGMPFLQVSEARMHAASVAHEVVLELRDLVTRIAWCWLLRMAGDPPP